jgi:hypothetical protein
MHEYSKLIKQFERLIKSNQKELELVNVGTEENEIQLKIEIVIIKKEKRNLMALLKEYANVFAWSYTYILGLDSGIIIHRLPLIMNYKPTK